MFSLSFLGGAVLERGGSPLVGRIVQRRRVALLAFLASSNGRPVSRDKLIACLWPESGAAQARHSLSDSVHVIRKALGEGAVLVEGDELRLAPEVVSCDVWRFEAALAAGDLEQAVRLYAGPFLDGFFVGGDALEFEGWAASERRRLGRAYVGALERLAERAIAAGEPRRAAEWWNRLCVEEPDNSRAVLGLMTALTAAGDRAGALRQAEEHTGHLKSEYGAEPDPTVTALVRRLQEAPETWVPGAAMPGRGTGATTAADASRTSVKRTFAPWRAFLGAAAAAILVLLTAFYVAQRQHGADLSLEETLATDAAPGIAVLPFSVNDPALETWREGMVDLLSVNLDGVPDLRAIDNRTVLARWGEAVPDTVGADLATALAVARRTGARYALMGSVVALGTNMRMTADVYEVKDGTRLGRGQVEGAPDSILSLVDRLTLEVVKALPRQASVLADVDLAELTTDSLAALKAYLSGEALYRRTDFKAAATAYERAIASDSTFALAWARLNDTCGWGSGSELCGQEPWDFGDFLSRLPARRAEVLAAYQEIIDLGPVQGIAAREKMVRKYPDDPDAWYRLGDAYEHFGDWALVDRTEGDRALERAIALAPTTSAEPYIHLIEHALADADSARVARLMEAYESLALKTASYEPAVIRLAFALGFGDLATRARTRATLDTIPTETLQRAIFYLGHPRLHDVSEEAMHVLRARPDHSAAANFDLFFRRGKLRAALESANDPEYPPSNRALLTYWLYQAGMDFPPEGLKQVLAAGAPDTTDVWFRPTFLLVGVYAVDRGRWDEYEIALDRERARIRRHLAEGDSIGVRRHEGMARALEGYALWKRGQKQEAIRALEVAQRQINGFERGLGTGGLNLTVRRWLGELMLEVDRPRDAERYFKSLPGDPFAALRLGKVYEDLGEHEKSRASYEYALLSWQDADPELQPRIQEARRARARLPKPLPRESP